MQIPIWTNNMSAFSLPYSHNAITMHATYCLQITFTPFATAGHSDNNFYFNFCSANI